MIENITDNLWLALRQKKFPISIRELDEECGVTAYSLYNAKKLIEKLGKPYSVILHHNNGEYAVKVSWRNGLGKYHHVFSGFSWGYAGEGPKGLHSFFNMIGLTYSLQDICSFPNDKEWKKKIL